MGKNRATINRNKILQGSCINRHRQFSAPKTLPAFHPRTANARANLILARERLPNWRKVAEWYGDLQKTTACYRLVKDPGFCPSIKLVEMIEAIDVPPLKIAVPVCPDCGAVHTGRCHGVPEPTVIVKSAHPRQPRAPRKSIHVSPDIWERLNTCRIEGGETWEQFLSELLD
jgi:hypothetical protein